MLLLLREFSMKNIHVLIAEDDKNTSALIETYLNREGFKTTAYYNGTEVLMAAQKQIFDLIVLDIMLPERDGWEICRELRKISDVPILILTAREEEIDRVLGLSLGADDYVVKPFSPREVVERVKAILRRTQNKPEQFPVFRIGNLELDASKRKVLLDGRPVELTGVEYKILQALMAMPGKAFSRDDLLNHIYERGETVVDRVVDVHIGHLRQKLGDDPSVPRFIETVRGYGYRLIEQEDQ